MIFPIDRLQFVNNNENLIAFEFFNIDNESTNKLFIEEKIKVITKCRFIDTLYNVAYHNDNQKELIIQSITLDKKKPSKCKVPFQIFSQWFNNLNHTNIDNRSKRLGLSTKNTGDPFVQDLLNKIYCGTKFQNIQFNFDDSGVELVEKVLNDNPTYGFDFDLFEETNNIIIEFLKRQNVDCFTKNGQ